MDKKYILFFIGLVLSISIVGIGTDTGNSLSVIEQIQYKTNPLISDTDGDGLTDYEEVHKFGTDPVRRDSDQDKLSDSEELFEHNTNPTIADTDRDGLTDYEEVEIYNTNPLVADTERDGLDDGEEVSKYNTNPTTSDTDNDGLDDGKEVGIYDSDPSVADTDEDGLTDAEEVLEYNTDPTSADTDNDGLTDYKEIYEYGSDPTKFDTNGSGLSDGENIEYGLNPVKIDSSGDGIPDVYTVAKPYLDPQRLNVTVEIDTDTQTDFPNKSVLKEIKHNFATAPVESDLGKNGINLTFIQSDKGIAPPDKKYSNINFEKYQDYQGHATFYMYYTDDITVKDNLGGLAPSHNDKFIVKSVTYSDIIIPHEIGHKLGLLPTKFKGIDSYEISYDSYESVMNYNYVYNIPSGNDYSSSESKFSDWQYIEDNIRKHNASTINIFK